MNYGTYPQSPVFSASGSEVNGGEMLTMFLVVVFAAFFGVLLTGIWFGYAKKRYQGPHVSPSLSSLDV